MQMFLQQLTTLRNFLHLFIWGKGLRQMCFKSFPTTGPKFHVLGAASSGPFFSLWNRWRRASFSLKEIYTSAPSSRTPVSTTATYLSSIWTSRMVLSIWDRLLGSLLQGTQRWITWGEKSSIIKHKFRRESCHIKVVADNSRPLQGKRSNNIKRYTDLVGCFSVTAYSQISYWFEVLLEICSLPENSQPLISISAGTNNLTQIRSK